jgi:HemY protein
MAELERTEHGNSPRVREWLARAAHAPRGPAWIADGLVSDRWSPISPVSGRLDAFSWGTPPDLIGGAGTTAVDDTLLDVDDRADDPVAIAPPSHARIVETPPASEPKVEARPEPKVEPKPEPKPVTVVETRTVEPAPVVATMAEPKSEPKSEPKPEPAAPDLTPPAESPPTPVITPDLKVDPIPTETPAEPAPVREASVTPLPVKTKGARRGNGHDRSAEPVPFTHPPDDPGPKPGAQKPSRFKLFG